MTDIDLEMKSFSSFPQLRLSSLFISLKVRIVKNRDISFFIVLQRRERDNYPCPYTACPRTRRIIKQQPPGPTEQHEKMRTIPYWSGFKRTRTLSLKLTIVEQKAMKGQIGLQWIRIIMDGGFMADFYENNIEDIIMKLVIKLNGDERNIVLSSYNISPRTIWKICSREASTTGTSQMELIIDFMINLSYDTFSGLSRKHSVNLINIRLTKSNKKSVSFFIFPKKMHKFSENMNILFNKPITKKDTLLYFGIIKCVKIQLDIQKIADFAWINYRTKVGNAIHFFLNWHLSEGGIFAIFKKSSNIKKSGSMSRHLQLHNACICLSWSKMSYKDSVKLVKICRSLKPPKKCLETSCDTFDHFYDVLKKIIVHVFSVDILWTEMTLKNKKNHDRPHTNFCGPPTVSNLNKSCQYFVQQFHLQLRSLDRLIHQNAIFRNRHLKEMIDIVHIIPCHISVFYDTSGTGASQPMTVITQPHKSILVSNQHTPAEPITAHVLRGNISGPCDLIAQTRKGTFYRQEIQHQEGETAECCGSPF
ncbi:unnamed protein product, partial [Meganyctiphanes norvegica]